MTPEDGEAIIINGRPSGNRESKATFVATRDANKDRTH